MGHFFERGISVRNYGVFLVRRFARVYPLFLVMTPLGILFWAHESGIAELARHKTQLLSNMFMVEGWGIAHSIDPPGWSVSDEWAAYLLFPLLLVMALRSSRLFATICLLACCAGLTIVSLSQFSPEQVGIRHGPLDETGLHSCYGVLRCVSGFGIGLLAYRFAKWRPIAACKSSSPIAIGFAGIFLVSLLIPDLDLQIGVFAAILIVLLSGTNMLARLLSSRPVVFFGEISYAVYLVHDLVLDRILHHREMLDQVPYLSFGLFVIGTMALAVAANRLVEVPARTWLRRLETAFTPRAEPDVIASELLGVEEVTAERSAA